MTQSRITHLCPEGKPLELYRIRRKNMMRGISSARFIKAKWMLEMRKKLQCTKQRYRTNFEVEDAARFLKKCIGG